MAHLHIQEQASLALTSGWNGEHDSLNPELILLPLTDWSSQENHQLIKTRFNLMYQALENMDAPDGQVLPISTAESLDENLEINYQKRALSFFHGAMLAIQHQPRLIDQEKTEAANKIIAVYNRFKNGPRYNQALENLYEAHWGRKQAYYLKKMLIRMSLELENFGMGYGDIKAGEMVANLERERPRIIQSNLSSEVNITETPLNAALNNPIYDNQYGFLEDETIKKPHWFIALKPVIQQYLIKNRHNPHLPAIPATLRGIPGLANMNIHQGVFKSDADPQFHVTNKVIRHGTLTPYDMESNTERTNATYANGRALAAFLVPDAMENFSNFWTQQAVDHLPIKIPMADLSFMTPLETEEAVVEYTESRKGKPAQSVFEERPSFSKIFRESNRAMKRENQAGYMHGVENHPLARSIELMPTNLGINGDRWEAGETFSASDYRATVLKAMGVFTAVKNFVSSFENKSEAFKTPESQNKFNMAILASDQLYHNDNNIMQTFNISFKHANANLKNLSRRINAELFANCLYAIVIEGMGGTVSACCKSTKDRTGLFILHLDAMHQYFAETGTLPAYDAPENSPQRLRFVSIMADLYLANTQQYAASQATFGAAGIKKPEGALGNMGAIPTDLLAALERKRPSIYAKQKELADINKIKFDIKWGKLHKVNRVGAWSQKQYETTLFTWESISWDSFTASISNTIDRFKRLFGFGLSENQVKKTAYMKID
jgi:hypothetical protein